MKKYKIVSMIAFMFLGFSTINGQDVTLGKISPNGKYQLILNEKNLDNNSRYFESYLIDLENDEKIVLAKNYKNDSLAPNWFWDKNSQYLIFEGREYGSVAKIQVWDLENQFVLFDVRGAIPSERAEAVEYWDAQNEELIFFNIENIEAPRSFVLNLKTRKVRDYVDPLDHFALEKNK